MSEPILTTKLYIPPRRPNAVLRSRLTERLNTSLHRRLTLICAPAGFGKTTLLSEWAATCNQPVAWLSVDEEHNDPTRFLIYLVAVLRTLTLSNGEAFFQLGESTLEALQSPQPPQLHSVLTTLLNEITRVSQEFILVLDDYHNLESQAVDQALMYLLEHMPPHMHLFIASREVPPLPLARFRARDELIELRASDLRFTEAETTEFLNRVMDLDLSRSDIAALESRTEGWITGLQLAAISLQGHRDTADFINSFSGSHYFVLDYLVEEVLQRQPESIQKFLLSTSILERLNGSLCDAVLPQASTSSQDILEYLERSNLLVFPLDDQRLWYRYHHLFADALQARLVQEDQDYVRELHLRACAWYKEHKLRPAAIYHALAAQDFQEAADLIEQDWLAKSGTYFQNPTWVGWVRMLPDDLTQTRPVLSLGLAWDLLFSGKLQAAADRLKDVNRLLELTDTAHHSLDTSSMSTTVATDDELPCLQALLAIAWAFHAQATGDDSTTIKYAEHALICLSEEDHYIIGLADSLLGLACWKNGDLDAAVRYMTGAVVYLRRANHFLFAISSTYVLAGIRIAQGRLFDAISIYEEALQFASTLGEPALPGTADLHLGLSKVYREQGKEDAARQHLLKCEALGKQAALPEWPYDLYLAQAQLKVDQGELDDALKYLEEADNLYRRQPVPSVQPIAALKTQVWLRQGRLAEALHWGRSRGLSTKDDIGASGVSYLHEFEYITLARTLLAHYEINRSEPIIHEAVELLAHLLKAAEEGGRDGSVIRILVLQALAHKAQGNTSFALTILEHALNLAKPEGYVRVFVDEGLPMAELLHEAAIQSIMPDYVNKLLVVFGAEKQQCSGQTNSPPQSLDPRANSIRESLSERELEILSLIAAGKKNQEIADQLIISINTVRYHTKNLYGKLGVNKRTQAVARSHELDLI